MGNLFSKKILFSTLFVIILLFTVIFIPKEKDTSPKKEVSPSDTSTEKIQGSDSDNDGLADWEEFLWKTDPKTPDSDLDGTNDGEEVSLSRDPLIKGPGDEISIDQKLVEENLTTTDKFGRDLFTTYANIINNQRFADNEDKLEVLYSLVSKNVSGVEKPTLYSAKNIRTTENSDDKTLKQYANSLVENFLEAKDYSEIAIITNILDKGDDKYDAELRELIMIHKKILNDNLNMIVPKDLVIQHAGVLNSHNRVIDSFVKISYVKTDPLIAMLGIGEYSKATEEFDNAIRILSEYYKRKDIFFSEKEPAYNLNHR
jgi:hypothetical protein